MNPTSPASSSAETGERFVSARMTTIASSGIRRIFDLAAKIENPINLSIGQPDFNVPEPIKQSAIQAILDNHNGYTLTHGIPELRDAIARRLQAEFDWQPSIFVTSGVSGGLVLAMIACLNPGDEVIFADPYFVSYPMLAELAGGRAVYVDTYPDFVLTPERLRAAVTDRTKMVLLSSPANPTGVVYPESVMKGLAEVAEERDLLIVSDEIYCMLTYDGPAASPVSYAPHRTLLLRGFAKSYSMTGWRLGYAAGPSRIIQEMAKLQQFTYVCAPSMVQHAGVTALDTDMSWHINDYRGKRDLAASILKEAFEFAAPSGGFYVFVKAPSRFRNATAFVEECIAQKVLVIPGNVFSKRDTHFRVSYAAPNERIEQGCRILCAIAKG